MLYLGIDGGGSKTTFLLVDDDDREIRRIQAGASNWLSVGAEAAAAAIAEGARRFSDVQPDVVCGGFAGAGRPEGLHFYRRVLEPLFASSRVIVESDAFIAYIGALGFAPGVLLIAGTGSIAIGRLADGSMIRVGGWGPHFGDEGSGFWTGREAVRAALRLLDSEQPNEFPQQIAHALSVASVRDVVAAWANGRIGVPDIAALFPLIIGMWPQEPAAEILKRAAEQLRSLVTIAVQRVGSVPCPVSVVGSVAAHLQMRKLIGLETRDPQAPPEQGAILVARCQPPFFGV
jgi:glucosamine kinase